MSVKSVNLSFPPSDSGDVVKYVLYIEEVPNPVTFESQNWDLGNKTSVDLSSLEGMTTKDGVYNIGVASVDDAGNTSSLSIMNDVPLDFVQPNPPGQLVITRS